MSEPCRFERDVVAGRITDTLRDHMSECVDCAAAASVSPWMQRFAGFSDREHILPNPAVLWLKAQLLRGSADAARISRPLTIVQLFSYAVIAAGWAALLTWKWDVVAAWLRGMTPSGIVANASSASGASLSFPFFAMILVLGSATAMLALHTIVADE
ncbi:MAG TPA: hypothetical protein VGF48_22425 [Thermoanaerobaculia bacterium]|jgi:hypothetical protein